MPLQALKLTAGGGDLTGPVCFKVNFSSCKIAVCQAWTTHQGQLFDPTEGKKLQIGKSASGTRLQSGRMRQRPYSELLSVDGLATGSVALGEVSTLALQLGWQVLRYQSTESLQSRLRMHGVQVFSSRDPRQSVP